MLKHKYTNTNTQGNLEPGACHQFHAILVHKGRVLVQNSSWRENGGGATLLPFFHPVKNVGEFLAS